MKLADLRAEVRDSVVYATVSGDIDMSNADELRDELSALTPNDALGVVADLSNVDYLDSAGIRLVHRLREDLRARGQKLRLVIPSGSLVRDTLRLAGLEWGEEIVETGDAARTAFAPRPSA